MSQTLTPDAPSNEPAAPSPEANAPGSGGEVTVGSAGGGDFVEKHRFDGLMSTFNRTKDDLESRLAAAQEEIESLRAAHDTRETPVSNDNEGDVAALRQQFDQLASVLLEERAENARLKVLDEYPEAKPFADMIVGNSPEEIREVAATIADRVKALQGGVPNPDDEEGPPPEGGDGDEGGSAPPAAPVVGAGTASPDAGELSTAKTEALARGDFSAYLDAAWEEQQFAANQNVA